MGGFMAGLGQGLTNAGQFVGQQILTQQELQRRAQQDALQNALAQQQLEIQKEAQRRLAEQQDFEKAKYLAGNLPANTPLSPEAVTFQQQHGMGAFIRPDMVGDPTKTPVQEGLPNALPGPGGAGLAGSIGNPLADQQPSGRGYSIPTEDSRARTALLNMQNQSMLQNQRLMAQAAIAQARNQLQAQLGQARNSVDRERIQAQLAAVNATMAAIQQRGTQFDAEQDWRYNVLAPNIDYDNAINAYRAENPASQQGSGFDVNTLLQMVTQGQQGPQVPAGTPANPAQPAPGAGAKRPPAPQPGPRAPRRKTYSDGSVAEEEMGPDGKPTGRWIQVKPPTKAPTAPSSSTIHPIRK